MIYESYYWKKELLILAAKLSKRIKSRKEWTEAQHGTFEREIMIGFYIIRKLLDAHKLTNSIVSRKITGTKFSNNGKMVTLRNNHRFHECYDLENPIKTKFELIFLCNQIVHSYIFFPFFECDDETGKGPLKLWSVVFNSDDNRNKWLYQLEVKRIIDLFNELGNDYPSSHHRIYDPKRNDYKVINSSGDVELPSDIEELIARKSQQKK